MPGIVEFPKLVQDAIADYGEVFSDERRRRHFAEYLTSLMVTERKTVLVFMASSPRPVIILPQSLPHFRGLGRGGFQRTTLARVAEGPIHSIQRSGRVTLSGAISGITVGCSVSGEMAHLAS